VLLVAKKDFRGKPSLESSCASRLIVIEFFCQCDHDALGATKITESVYVLVLHHLANKFGAVLLQAGNDVVDVSDGEHEATYTERVHWRIRFSFDWLRFVKLAQLKPAVAIRSPHHDDVALDAIEAHDSINPWSLNGRLTFEFQTKFCKERDSSFEVVDNDGNIVHS